MLHNCGLYVIFPMNCTQESWGNQSAIETVGLSVEKKKNLNYYFQYVTSVFQHENNVMY